MRKNNQDFFVEMKRYEIAGVNLKYNISQMVVYVMTFAFLVIAELLLWDLWPQNETSSIIIAIITVVFVIGFIFMTIFAFKKNSYYFKNGDILGGIKNYAICVIIVYAVLVFLYFSFSDGEARSLVSSLFASVTTLFAAVLAMMGVHYTHSNQQKNLANKNNLVFQIVDAADYEIEIKGSAGTKITNICLQNVSDNYGYFVGLYNICGCDARKVGDDFTYQPILPQKSYIFTNVYTSIYDETLMLVYKDISDNYYYIQMCYNMKQELVIKSADKCNVEFLDERLAETEFVERSVRPKSENEKVNINVSADVDEFKIKQRKEETKPLYTQRIAGYDLVLDSHGKTLTDTALLSRLKSEREKISKDNKVRAYMILNNQQLVAIATYKPMNREDFISIYGLGEKKYELYGARMIEIVKEFDSSMVTV